MIPPGNVLIVDDNPAIRGFIAMVLEDEGFAVASAAHGREALTEAHRRLPDVVILDLMMPVMSGREFINAWQSDPVTRHIPIIVVSAAYSATTAAALGVQAFLRKPFDLDRLLTVLQKLLDEREDARPL